MTKLPGSFTCVPHAALAMSPAHLRMYLLVSALTMGGQNYLPATDIRKWAENLYGLSSRQANRLLKGLHTDGYIVVASDKTISIALAYLVTDAARSVRKDGQEIKEVLEACKPCAAPQPIACRYDETPELSTNQDAQRPDADADQDAQRLDSGRSASRPNNKDLDINTNSARAHARKDKYGDYVREAESTKLTPEQAKEQIDKIKSQHWKGR